MAVLGGVLIGSRQTRCVVGTSPADICDETSFPTAGPRDTLEECREYLAAQAKFLGGYAAVGVCAYGTIDADPRSVSYGEIIATRDNSWRGQNLVTPFQSLARSIALDTPAVAAGLAELRWGAAKGMQHIVYFSAGAHIHAALLSEGRPVRGLCTPEFGHMRVPHDLEADPFIGNCPYHDDCLQGLAGETAMEQRWREPVDALPENHPAWLVASYYLGVALANLTTTVAPQRILLGGPLLRRSQLVALVRDQVAGLLNECLPHPYVTRQLDQYIVPPKLGERVETLGLLALAAQTADWV